MLDTQSALDKQRVTVSDLKSRLDLANTASSNNADVSKNASLKDALDAAQTAWKAADEKLKNDLIQVNDAINAFNDGLRTETALALAARDENAASNSSGRDVALCPYVSVRRAEAK